eukprot:Hpha_TRINITY_DN16367_c1_g3::TRINITY_DN16367_c1_g3_i1::g.62872::m.62872
MLVVSGAKDYSFVCGTCQGPISGSEGEDRVLIVAGLGQVGMARELNHGRGATKEGNGVAARRVETLAAHGLVDEAFAEVPLLTLGHTVHSVPPLHTVGVLLLEGVELVLQNDVIGRLVSKQQRDLRVVAGVTQHVGHHLQHRRDARPPRNHVELLRLPHILTFPAPATLAVVLPPPDWPLEGKRIPDLHGLHVLGHHTAQGELRVLVGKVDLNNEVNVPLNLVTSGGSVGPLHRLALLVDVFQREVLAHRQTQAVLGAGEGETELPDVVGEGPFLGEFEGDRRLPLQSHEPGSRYAGCVDGGRLGGVLGMDAGGEGGVANNTDAKVVQLLDRRVRVPHILKLSSRVPPRHLHDHLSPTRMLHQILGDVVDSVVVDKPAIILRVVLSNLRRGEPLETGRKGGGGGAGGGGGDFRGGLLLETAKQNQNTPEEPDQGQGRAKGVTSEETTQLREQPRLLGLLRHRLGRHSLTPHWYCATHDKTNTIKYRNC